VLMIIRDVEICRGHFSESKKTGEMVEYRSLESVSTYSPSTVKIIPIPCGHIQSTGSLFLVSLHMVLSW